MDLTSLIESAEKELGKLEVRRSELIAQIAELKRALTDFCHKPPFPDDLNILHEEPAGDRISEKSPIELKITLYCSLFRGREDVFPRRFESLKTGRSGYQPACRNEWVKGICRKPSVKCNECDCREFIPLSNEVIRNHLMGYDPADKYRRDFVVGIYPLLTDSTCWFLAADFDKSSWQDDAAAFLQKCRSLNIPAILERSRSGLGGHIWIFFEEPIPAITARRMGSYLLTEVMDERPDIGLNSYDRLFPMPNATPPLLKTYAPRLMTDAHRLC
ncbi:MAG: hypothetical protein JW913_20935 [Chitinispirillaceae bacterium]|nr:hypothetical protein [Chitinispirillaceae bacterium]